MPWSLGQAPLLHDLYSACCEDGLFCADDDGQKWQVSCLLPICIRNLTSSAWFPLLYSFFRWPSPLPWWYTLQPFSSHPSLLPLMLESCPALQEARWAACLPLCILWAAPPLAECPRSLSCAPTNLSATQRLLARFSPSGLPKTSFPGGCRSLRGAPQLLIPWNHSTAWLHLGAELACSSAHELAELDYGSSGSRPSWWEGPFRLLWRYIHTCLPW